MSYTIALIQCEVRNEIKENLKTAEYYTKKAIKDWQRGNTGF